MSEDNKQTTSVPKKHQSGSLAILDSILSEKAESKTDVAVTTKKATVGKSKNRGKKAVRQVALGNVYIQATYNNTIVSFADQNGNVIGWSSAGKCGFKGPKKATPYAAGVVVKNAIDKITENGLKDIHVFVKGVGLGREAAIRALNANGMEVISIKDITPIPHNGCRRKKTRRV